MTATAEQSAPGDARSTVRVCPGSAEPPRAVPAPVLAPYLGLAAAVLCALVGGWLLLAPYALDLRHGADRPPRPVVVELATGAAITAAALLTAILFGAALVTRLRMRPGMPPAARPEPEEQPEATRPPHAQRAAAAVPDRDSVPDLDRVSDLNPLPDVNRVPDLGPGPAPDLGRAREPGPGAGPERGPGADPDPGGALHELLTPLIAALAADLRNRDRSGHRDPEQNGQE